MTATLDRVTVVGGGIVGLCTAHFLALEGCRVTVIERSKVARGASLGNVGEIATNLAVPLPAPGMIREGLQSLTNPDGAMYIRPAADIGLLRFLLGFSKFTSKARYMQGARALLGFAADSRELFAELDGTGAISGKDGYVYAYSSADKAKASFKGKQEIGAPVHGGLLDRDALYALEPSLRSTPASAGFLVEDQWWVDPGRFVEGLADNLRSRGVEIIEGARVTSIQDDGPGPVVVHTTTGDVEGEAVVLASGFDSLALTRKLGVDLNMFPGKGYSFSVEADTVPQRVVNVGDAHVVFTPLAGRVRVGGTMELDRNTDTLNHRRIAAIVNAASPYLKADWNNRTNEWVGTRVLTPDGLPAIGRLPGTKRVIVATGHNMMGMVLGPATGRLVTDILTSGPSSDTTSPFDPSRLARRVRRA